MPNFPMSARVKGFAARVIGKGNEVQKKCTISACEAASTMADSPAAEATDEDGPTCQCQRALSPHCSASAQEITLSRTNARNSQGNL